MNSLVELFHRQQANRGSGLVMLVIEIAITFLLILGFDCFQLAESFDNSTRLCFNLKELSVVACATENTLRFSVLPVNVLWFKFTLFALVEVHGRADDSESGFDCDVTAERMSFNDLSWVCPRCRRRRQACCLSLGFS